MKPTTAMTHSPKVIDLPASKPKVAFYDDGDGVGAIGAGVGAAIGLGIVAALTNREKVDSDEERGAGTPEQPRLRGGFGRPRRANHGSTE